MTHSSPLDAALHYAEIGWHVFPCKPNKHPHTAHGHLDATTDANAIVTWWRQWPGAQVGVACGASALCVVDLDHDASASINGPLFFQRLSDEHGPHWCELVATTPRGGRHLVYRMPVPAVGCRTNAIPKSGIDVRADGGYVIVPSPASLNREWITGEPGESQLTAPPEWIERLILTRVAGTAKAAAPGSAPATVLAESEVASIRAALVFVDCEPRETWIRVAMALKSTGGGQAAYDLWCEWSQQSAKYDQRVQFSQWRSLREFFADGHEITLGSLFHEAAANGYRYQGVAIELEQVAPPEPEEPTAETVIYESTPKARPFPRDLINCPGLVGDITAWLLSCSPRPQPALCLASALVTLGALLGRRVATATDLRTNIYCLGVGMTGCGKDASVRLPSALLTRAGCAWAVGPGEWKSDSGLRAALVEAPSHAAYVDEFTKVLEQMAGTRIPGHIAGIKRYILDLYAASNGSHLAPAYADRKVNAPVVIEQPNLCLYGTGTPGELFRSLDRGAFSDGFLNRILIFWADEEFPRRLKTERAEPPVALVEAIEDLVKATSTGDLAGMAQASPRVKVIPMTVEAEAMIDALYAEEDARVAKLRATSNPLADLWVRFAGHVTKLALIRVAGDDPMREIEGEDVRWAIRVVEWSVERTMMEADSRVADNPQEAALLRVRRVITDAGSAGLTRAELTRRTQWLRGSERKDIVASLVEGGSVTAEANQVSRPGRGEITAVRFYRTGLQAFKAGGKSSSGSEHAMNGQKLSDDGELGKE